MMESKAYSLNFCTVIFPELHDTLVLLIREYWTTENVVLFFSYIFPTEAFCGLLLEILIFLSKFRNKILDYFNPKC